MPRWWTRAALPAGLALATSLLALLMLPGQAAALPDAHFTSSVFAMGERPDGTIVYDPVTTDTEYRDCNGLNTIEELRILEAGGTDTLCDFYLRAFWGTLHQEGAATLGACHWVNPVYSRPAWCPSAPNPTTYTITGPATAATATTTAYQDGNLQTTVGMQWSGDPHLMQFDFTFADASATQNLTGIRVRFVTPFTQPAQTPDAWQTTNVTLDGVRPPPPTLACSSDGDGTRTVPAPDCVAAVTPSACRALTTDTTWTAAPAPVAGPGTLSGGPLAWSVFPSPVTSCQHGATFDFAVGDLEHGQARSFRMFWGTAMGGAAALRTALANVGAEFWALGVVAEKDPSLTHSLMMGFRGLYPPTAGLTWTSPPPGWDVPGFVAGVTACAGSPVTFTGAATAGSAPVATSAWAFGDGASATLTPGPGAPSHTYASAGTYGVRLRVVDANGWPGTASAAVVVLDCHAPPVARFAFFGGGADCASNRVVFEDAGSFDPDGGSIASYAWDFGDGATAVGNPATHQYEEDARVTVTLTVTDDEGQTAAMTQPYPAPGDPDCPPLLEPLSTYHAQAGQPLAIPLHATDADGPTLTILRVAGPGGELDVTPGTLNADGQFTLVPTATGTYTLTFRAWDGTAYDEKQARILVYAGSDVDSDHDGIPDAADDCPNVPDQGQADANQDGIGDACEDAAPSAPPGAATADARGGAQDRDRDGIQDQADDCPDVPDHGQADLDGDGVGDACDMDQDGDGVPDVALAGAARDDCPRLFDPRQDLPCGPSTAARPPRLAGAPQPTSAASSGVGVGALLTALVAALAAIAWRGRAGLVVLFSRLSSGALLDHPVRSRLAEVVANQPGLQQRELARRLGLGRGTVEHHLRVLAAAGLVERRRVGGMVGYHPAGGGIGPAAVALRSATAQRVLGALASEPERLGVRRLGRHLGLTHATVTYHIRRLRDAGYVVRSSGVWRLTDHGRAAVKA